MKTERLTDVRVGYTKLQDNANIDEVVEKLGQLEDIEQELGIDLAALFKAFNGIVFRDGNVINFSHHIALIKNHYGWCIEPLEMRLQNKQLFLLLKEYGITWALTEEELEDQK